jgi:DNA replicative helicase MCM subunit Mcm2 (Cdc46/Mcm family)
LDGLLENSKRYLQLLSEIINEVRESPSDVNTSNYRPQVASGESMQNKRFATEIARKQYQILLNPGTLIKNEGLRNIRASHVGHLVRFQVIKTTQFITSKLV